MSNVEWQKYLTATPAEKIDMVFVELFLGHGKDDPPLTQKVTALEANQKIAVWILNILIGQFLLLVAALIGAVYVGLKH